MPASRTSALLLATLAVAAPAGAQQNHDHAPSPDPLVIEVDMRDYAFAPAPLRIPAGQPVTLVFTNTGNVEHEFMAGRRPANGDFEVDLFEGVAVETGTAPADDHGATPHDHPTDAAPHDHTDSGAAHDHADAGATAHDHTADGHGTMVQAEVGGRVTMSFTLPADRRGEWEMACFLPRHYERGMHGVLTVY
ncbi:MAG: cupredoxin domain-containing protein [Gemmatimonadales bacterium]